MEINSLEHCLRSIARARIARKKPGGLLPNLLRYVGDVVPSSSTHSKPVDSDYNSLADDAHNVRNTELPDSVRARSLQCSCSTVANNVSDVLHDAPPPAAAAIVREPVTGDLTGIAWNCRSLGA